MGTHVSELENYVPSRRSAFRAIGLGSVALATVPIAVLSASNEAHADATLVRLGDEFDCLHATWIPLWWESRQAGERCRDMLEALDRPFNIESYGEACRDSGLDAAADQSDEVLDRLHAIADQIRAMPARTVAGLHVKARVMLHESFAPSAYDGVADIDMAWSVLCHVQFMREIKALAGELRA